MSEHDHDPTDHPLTGRLPDALALPDGKRIALAEAWQSLGRPRCIELFERHVYGVTPKIKTSVTASPLEEQPALDGRARLTQARLTASTAVGEASWDVALFLPADTPGPTPVMLAFNFHGNASVTHDPHVWARPDTDTEPRGASADRYPINLALGHGVGVATIARHQLALDDPSDWRRGVASALSGVTQSSPEAHGFGAIAAWAWGASRTLDWLCTQPEVNHQSVTLLGHSRLGKAALWAAALDERFAAVIANNSGCGGAALSRRAVGESIAAINDRFPHWFCGRFKHYADRANELPIDQHQLIALIAPRPVYIASATEDLWADPRGEYLGLFHAGPVYALHGLPVLTDSRSPPPSHPMHGSMSYHLRPGKHDLTELDWSWFLARGLTAESLAPSQESL